MAIVNADCVEQQHDTKLPHYYLIDIVDGAIRIYALMRN